MIRSGAFALTTLQGLVPAAFERRDARAGRPLRGSVISPHSAHVGP